MSATIDHDEIQRQQDRINDLMKGVDDAYNRAAKNGGLTPSQFDILYALNEGEGLTQKQICDKSYTGKQTVNAAIHKMEQEGLLRLEPGGGRSLLVYLTDSGRKLTDRVIEPICQAERSALESLSNADRSVLLDIMHRYSTDLTGRLDATAVQLKAKRRA
jgi:DNA-binding MarR family transcriptional regulator